MHHHPEAIHPNAVHPDAFLPAAFRLRQSALTAHDRNNASATEAFAWLASLVEQVPTLHAPPALMTVAGEQVVVDFSDFRLPAGTDAVVLHHDGSLAINAVEHNTQGSSEREGFGPWRPSTLPGARSQRAGVTILGRVIARAAPRLAA